MKILFEIPSRPHAPDFFVGVSFNESRTVAGRGSSDNAGARGSDARAGGGGGSGAVHCFFFFLWRERERRRREIYAALACSTDHFFFSFFFRLSFFPIKKTKTKNSATMGRRYKAKLHVLEEDDLASILTPAPPCKVPGLGTKGEEEGVEQQGARLFFSLPFFFFCGSRRHLRFECAVGFFLPLSDQGTSRIRSGSVQCGPLVVRVWEDKRWLAS